MFFLEASGGRIHSANADGSDRKVIVSGARVPDGVVVDVEAGHIYWTNMGVPSKNDGSIERVDLDGRNRVTIIGEGKTFTPKQLHLEKKSGKLYWCDREGMRVMRANLDGSNIETLVDTSKGDARPGTDLTKWCVGITVDPDRGTNLLDAKRTRRTPARAASFVRRSTSRKARRRRIAPTSKLLFDGLPEPIDLELDLKNRFLYWTDRGDPPRGNTVNRASIDADFSKHPTPDILLTHLMEGIGIALDFKGNRMFVTDLAGNIFTAKLDGSEKKPLLVAQGNLTGIAYAEVS